MTSIRTKIVKAYGLLALIATVILLLPLYYATERYLFDQVTNELKTETSAVHALLREMGKRNTPWEHVVGSLKGIAGATKIRVTLIDSAGSVVFESSLAESLWTSMENHRDRPEVIRSLDRGIGINVRVSQSLGMRMIYVARQLEPWVVHGTGLPPVRVIRMGLATADFDRQIRDLRWMFVIAGVLALVAILTVSKFVSDRITRPIVEIGEIVKDIKGGDLDRKLPIRSEDEIGNLAELINEMTATLKEDIRQLRRLERFRSEFLGNVSHELRTPIFSLIGFLETLLDGALDDPKVSRQFVEKAHHHAERLDTLLKDLIEISRIESGEMRMSFRYFNIRSFLVQVREDYSDQALKKSQELIIGNAGSEITAYGDKDRLRQALGNIVDNAIKYSPDGARITLGVREESDAIYVSVRDTGPGIAQEHLPRIFERFYRVDTNRSREVGGTGLGLAITKHIIDAHQGRIRVESTLGTGSVFEFDLRR